MNCPHCGRNTVVEFGPDRFGFKHISCLSCHWSKWDTTIAQEMAKKELNVDVRTFREVGVEA